MKEKKLKFKNTKKPRAPSSELDRLFSEQVALAKLTENAKFGECDYIHSTIFSKIRALVCSGSWTMNPLLQRVMGLYNISLSFYTSTSIRTDPDSELNQLIMSKLWSVTARIPYSVNVNIDDYLSEKLYYNPFENRYLSRNELIRLFADSDGSHFDPVDDKYVQWLIDAKIKTPHFTISQKELFMWDIYLLLDWHCHRIKVELELRQLIKLYNLSPNLIEYYKSKVEELSNHFDDILQGSMLIFSSKGIKLCEDCGVGKLEKNSEITLKCQSCGSIKEL